MKLNNYIIIFFFIIFLFVFIGSIPENYNEKINVLKIDLVKNGIPEEWIDENINDSRFQIYYELEELYKKMPENLVKNKEKDFDWYKNKFGLEEKIILGKKFINNNKEILNKIENKNGIHYELIVSILGMETNYGDKRYIGKYYVFPIIVSHYILFESKKKFALRELISLYNFCIKTGKSTYNFQGSYSGATGFAQFIPSSLSYYFIDYNNIDSDIDVYSFDDALSSIENYLFQNRLSRKNIEIHNERLNAVLKYNHSSAYADAVLYIYNELRKNRS